tara:strand:+ start:2032 stop:3036 length:1005 start_codon:yes stop_codon:yes gene_type:complete
MKKPRVICIGEALFDRIIDKSNNKFKDYIGGAPLNVACALSKLNINVSFISCLGDDLYGIQIINLLKKQNIDYSFLQIDAKYPTRIVNVSRDISGDRKFVGFETSSSDHFSDEMLLKTTFKENINKLRESLLETKFIVAGTIPLAFKESRDSLLFLLDFAKSLHIPVVIDVNWRDIFWDNSKLMNNVKRSDQINLVKQYLLKADILKLAKEEAILFFATSDPFKISKSLCREPDVIITDGPNPISWFIKGFQDTTKVISSLPIIDTTGAGDAFLAGLISRFCKIDGTTNRSTLQSDIQYASICGLLTCSGEGAIGTQPNNQEVQRFLEKFGSVT